MLSSTNFLMGFAGLIYLVAGVFIRRKEISATRGWGKLITLGCVFIAVSLAVFAPEHFHGGPTYIQNMAPSWMPARHRCNASAFASFPAAHGKSRTWRDPEHGVGRWLRRDA